jgi:N-acetylglucosamine-6-phosphate deacetylase
MIALTAKRLYTPIDCIERAVVLIEDGIIAAIESQDGYVVPTSARLIDLEDGILAPGFIDLHIHGAAGHDVMASNPQGLAAMETFLAQHGVTGYFPTTVTASVDSTLAALQRLADGIEVREKAPPGVQSARPLGIHIEGPFLSHARRGVHPPEDLLLPTLTMFERLWDAARGRIRLMTIAPELPGARDVIAEASRRGVCVSVGHSDADLPSTQAGIAAGARHATHTFNAMRPLNHRDPGILGAVLTDARLTADIIADGLHVDPAVVRLFLNAKGPDRAVLITDATSATGMPDGVYRIGTLEIEVKQGKCLANGILAGSVLTLDRAVRNVMQVAQWDLQQTLRLATTNPAQVAGLSDRGTLRVGSRADLVVLNQKGEVKKTIVGGAGI